METVWFGTLISAICLEGLGRRYLPMIPAFAFYFLKDAVLIFGYVQFRPKPAVTRTVRYLYRGFGMVWAIGFVFTLLEMVNPQQQSIILAFIGMRSYWMWWLAPPVIASVLQEKRQKEKAIYALLILAIGVSALAAAQFASPADSSMNMYTVWNGEEIYAADSAIVASTGRARVASTFAYVSGFVSFTLLVPALLLSLGLDSDNPKVRRAALIGTFVTAAVVPMSGSRSSVVIGGAILGLSLWTAGLFFTRMGRRVLFGAGVAAVLAVVAFPEAFAGVQSRFENTEETNGRFAELANFLPPVALAVYDYPMAGIGTGMQQNARASFRVASQWDVEAEAGRYLVELGPVGYLLIWTAKFGMMVALLRSYKILKRAGRRGSSGAALSYGALTLLGNTTFDHNWQALYFMGCGFVLAEVVSVRQQQAMAAAAAIDSPTGTAVAARPAAA